MNKYYIIFVVGYFISFCSCKSDKLDGSKGDKIVYEAEVTEMTDEDYPDNNDIASRCADWQNYKHHKVTFERLDSTHFTLTFFPSSALSDTIKIEHINLLEWIPTIPTYIKDDYLKLLGIVNAEWNRQQVKFVKDEFIISKYSKEGKKTTRVDLARNCLNSYLWEMITYATEKGKDKPLYHGWFEFPRDLYEELFEEVNKGRLSFKEYKAYLVNYKDPERKVVDLNQLRTVAESDTVLCTSLNDSFYPKTGARKSKFKNIVYPKNPTSINDFLTDSTTFSTFLYPGYYSTSDPRSTTLSKLRYPKKVVVNKVTSKNNSKNDYLEFQVTFARSSDTTNLTTVVIGGIQYRQLKQLAVEDYNKGLKMPMGIGNHAFYENADYAQHHSSKENPYYAFILDREGKWLDSHFFGVDGPLFHLDENNPNLLHYWLLSFERHAMVTHLTFEIN